MKIKNYLSIFFLTCVIVSCNKATNIDKDQSIKPYSENSRYWQYKSKPVLLIGGTKDDNLFQIPGLKGHLDSLKAIGGNYIRNVMSSRVDKGFEVQPFKKLANGKYDLNQWDDEYWGRFEKMLKLTHEREIIVQIEFWATYDVYGYGGWSPWNSQPWNPANNVNYTSAETRLPTNWSRKPSPTNPDHPFYLVIPALDNVPVVLGYQKAFVRHILSYTLQYDHVLYTVKNETCLPQVFSNFWAQFIHSEANNAGRQVYVSDMDWYIKKQGDNISLLTNPIVKYPNLFQFVEASPIAAPGGEDQSYYDDIQTVRSKVSVPLNHTKIYGDDAIAWSNGDEEGVERFWRSIIGGSASMRFHRTGGGIGLEPRAQNCIKAVRKAETLVKMWEIDPAMDLLSQRSEDEAYLAAKPGEKYIIYFTKGGTVGLNLSDYQEKFRLRWIDINTGDWLKGETYFEGGKIVNISAPFQNPSIAMILKMNLFTIDE